MGVKKARLKTVIRQVRDSEARIVPPLRDWSSVMVHMTLLLLSSTAIALASFRPAVRVDQQNLPNHMRYRCAMAIGPGAPSSQPIYVAFEDDSTVFGVRRDIMFQKSNDAGGTWLPVDLLIRRGAPHAENPDITTDLDGYVYIVYKDKYTDSTGAYHQQILCTRSTDGGATWSAPAGVDDESSGGIGLTSIAADSSGSLFVAWNQLPGGLSRIFTSVSTDRGVTWSPRVCVDDDSLTDESYHPEVFVQPGTNHYLVATTTFRRMGGHSKAHAYLYRSTDRGQTFEPGVQLDTFEWGRHPHVVADRDHIICDYFGEWRIDDRIFVDARTYYTQADSWGSPTTVTNLDSLHELYYSGALALSGDGRVHTALMVDDTALGYDIYYASSSDHGVSWSDIEPVYVDTIKNNWYPDIVADAAGYAYVVWQHGGGDGQIWFATNNPAAIAEGPPQVSGGAKAHAITGHGGIEVEYQLPAAARVRATVHDAVGRQLGVLDVGSQQPGTHRLSWNQDRGGRKLASGAYFVLLDMGSEKSTLKAVIR
jgi:hypothetical protein